VKRNASLLDAEGSSVEQEMRQPATRPRLYLTPDDHGRPLTIEDLTSADAREGYRYELIRGRLEVSPLPDLPHDRLLRWLRRLLENYAKQHPEVVNEAFGPARIFLPDLEEGVTAPEPDVVAYRDFPLDLPEEEVNWQDLQPVVAVEILSPDTADKDLVRNVELYLRAPTIREYWIVDPRESYRRPSLLVYRRRGQRWQRPIRVEGGGTYTTPLLPDFTLTLDQRARPSRPSFRR
jgi:Uma2 family endonuclease